MRRRTAVSRKIPDFTPCGYCFQEYATQWDHIKPVADGGFNLASNLYPSCARCNNLLGANTFDTLAERRAYVRRILKQRKQWMCSKKYSEELRPLNEHGVSIQ